MRIITYCLTVAAALAWLFGAYQTAHWMDDYQAGLACAVYWNLLPALLLSALAYLLWRFPARRHYGRPVIIAALCILAIYAGVLKLNHLFYLSMATITDPRQYAETMARHWRNDPVAAHFPKTLPSDARDVRFTSSPHFGQGGPSTILRYTTTEARIRDLYRTFAPQQDDSVPDEDYSDYAYTLDGDDRITYDAIINLKKTPRAAKYGEGYLQTRGVAISRKRHIIVYWALEAW